jgi:hypothetical protein
LANAQRKFEALTHADEEEKRKLEARSAALGRKMASTIEIQAAQVRSEQAGIAIAEKQIENLERDIEYRRKVKAATARVAVQGSKLIDSRALSDLDNMRIQLEADRARLDLQQGERELSSARLKLQQLRTEHEAQEKERAIVRDQLAVDTRDSETALEKLHRQREAAVEEYAELRRGLNETIDKSTIRMAALKKELERSQGNETTVVAPCSGSLLRLKVKGAGAFVRTGEVLCELAQMNQHLEAELEVPQRGVGRVSAGLPVKLLYDAFPYQRHGVRYGTVRWVGLASTTGDNGDVFRVWVDPQDAAIEVDGQQRRLLAGMRGEAQIVVGRRRLISYLFEPLRQLQENMK